MFKDLFQKAGSEVWPVRAHTLTVLEHFTVLNNKIFGLNNSKWHPTCMARPGARFFFPVRHATQAAGQCWQRQPLSCTICVLSFYLVQSPDVVLSEHAAQSLVDAVSCSSKAVLVAGPAAPARLGCVQQSGGKHNANHEKPDASHADKVPGTLSSSGY